MDKRNKAEPSGERKQRRRYEKPASLGAAVFERRSLSCSMKNTAGPFCNAQS